MCQGSYDTINQNVVYFHELIKTKCVLYAEYNEIFIG